MKKYELTSNTIRVYGTDLYQIKALRDFSDVKKGDLGGYVRCEDNLSHDGNCWVYDQAWALHNTRLLHNATMAHKTVISDNSKLIDNAKMVDCAFMTGNTLIGSNTVLSGSMSITDKGNW